MPETTTEQVSAEEALKRWQELLEKCKPLEAKLAEVQPEYTRLCKIAVEASSRHNHFHGNMAHTTEDAKKRFGSVNVGISKEEADKAFWPISDVRASIAAEIGVARRAAHDAWLLTEENPLGPYPFTAMQLEDLLSFESTPLDGCGSPYCCPAADSDDVAVVHKLAAEVLSLRQQLADR